VIGSEEKPGDPGFFSLGMLPGAIVCYRELEQFWNIFIKGRWHTPPYGHRLYGTYPHAAEKQKATLSHF
jgi:hypothetical protein